MKVNPWIILPFFVAWATWITIGRFNSDTQGRDLERLRDEIKTVRSDMSGFMHSLTRFELWFEIVGKVKK